MVFRTGIELIPHRGGANYSDPSSPLVFVTIVSLFFHPRDFRFCVLPPHLFFSLSLTAASGDFFSLNNCTISICCHCLSYFVGNKCPSERLSGDLIPYPCVVLQRESKYTP